MKANEAIPRALFEIGVRGIGQTMPGEYLDEALIILQRMMNAWQVQLGASLYFQRTVQAITSGVRDYTIGAGATIDQVRPDKIRYASFILDSTASPVTEQRIAVLSDQEWALVRQKTLTAPALDAIYFDRGSFASAIRGTISTYPTISGTNRQFVLYTNPLVPASVFADASTDYVFPPGMEEAIHYGLARKCCRPFGVQLTQDIVDDADRSLAVFMRSAHQPGELRIDRSLTDRRTYDFDSDTFRP